MASLPPLYRAPNPVQFPGDFWVGRRKHRSNCLLRGHIAGIAGRYLFLGPMDTPPLEELSLVPANEYPRVGYTGRYRSFHLA